MRYEHANGALDFIGSGAKNCAVHRGAGDCAVHYVINLVRLEGKNFRQASANFINAHHRAQRHQAVFFGKLRRGDSHWIKIIVSKLACGVIEFGSIAKVGSVGVPLAHSGAVGHDGFFWRHQFVAAKNGHAIFVAVTQRFFAQQHRRVGAKRQRAHSAQHRVSVEQRGSIKHRLRWLAFSQKINRVLTNAQSLVCVTGQNARRSCFTHTGNIAFNNSTTPLPWVAMVSRMGLPEATSRSSRTNLASPA